MLKTVGKVNTPDSEAKLSVVRLALVQAGYRGADAPFIFLGIKLYLAVLAPVVQARRFAPTQGSARLCACCGRSSCGCCCASP